MSCCHAMLCQAETAVHSCHLLSDMAVRMREVLVTPRSCVGWPLHSDGLFHKKHASIKVNRLPAYIAHYSKSLIILWISQVFFFCLNEPADGCSGETPLAKNSELISKLDPDVLQKFEEKQIRYVRYLPLKSPGEQFKWMTWQETFTTEKKEVHSVLAWNFFCCFHEILGRSLMPRLVQLPRLCSQQGKCVKTLFLLQHCRSVESGNRLYSLRCWFCCPTDRSCDSTLGSSLF